MGWTGFLEEIHEYEARVLYANEDDQISRVASPVEPPFNHRWT